MFNNVVQNICWNGIIESVQSEFERSKIERAKVGINTPGTEDELRKKIPTLSPMKQKPPENWSDNITSVAEVRRQAKAGSGARLVRTLLIFAILAIVGSGSFLMYKLFDPFARPSDKNISIVPEFPVAISSGETASLDLVIENHNRAALESVVVTYLYPSGTKSADEPLQDLREEKRTVGTIAGGARTTVEASAIFLGTENTDKEVITLLEYRFSGISSEFRKEIRTPVHLTSSPVNIRVRTLEEVNSGQQFDYVVDVTSNTVIPIDGVVLRIDYPPGFMVSEIEPKPEVGDNLWKVGRLEPTGKYQVRLKGIINGEDTEKRVFYTIAGTGSSLSERDVSTEYSKILTEMTLKKPFINLAVLFNSKTDAVASPGAKVPGSVVWKNTTPFPITNVQIEVRMKGNVNKRSIMAPGGFYRSIDDTLYWDERTDRNLTLVGPGESGSVVFSFESIPVVSGSDVLRNPIISAEVTVRGKRVDANNVPEEFSTAAVGAVRIASEPQFASKVTHFVGPLANRGPIPPRVNEETTYTVSWTIVNTSNDLESVAVRTRIPVQVRWSGAIVPGDAAVTYDPVRHEIVWLAGRIPAGTGVSTPAREAHFQLGVIPSTTQLAKPVPITEGIEFSARDSYTGREFSQSEPAASTGLAADPKAGPSDGLVVE